MRDIKKSLGRKNPTEAFKKFFFYAVNRLPHRKTKCRYKRSLTFVTIIANFWPYSKEVCVKGVKKSGHLELCKNPLKILLPKNYYFYIEIV